MRERAVNSKKETVNKRKNPFERESMLRAGQVHDRSRNRVRVARKLWANGLTCQGSNYRQLKAAREMSRPALFTRQGFYYLNSGAGVHQQKKLPGRFFQVERFQLPRKLCSYTQRIDSCLPKTSIQNLCTCIVKATQKTSCTFPEKLQKSLFSCINPSKYVFFCN